MKKVKKHIRFSDKVLEVLHKDFGYTNFSLVDLAIMPCLEKYDALFFDLESIAVNHNVYDLHRALHATEDILHKVSEDLIQKRLIPQLDILRKYILENGEEDIKTITVDLAKIRDIEKKKERVMHRNARMFKAFSYFISAVDIALLVLVITLASKTGYWGKEFFDSSFLFTGFLFGITLLKVLLDRYIVSPRVHRLGRKRFQKRVDEVEYDTGILAAIIFLLMHFNHGSRSVQKTLKILEKGIYLMNEKF